MPYGMTDFGTDNSTDYSHIVADTATIRVSTDAAPVQEEALTMPSAGGVFYYTLNDAVEVREPEPTVEELIEDADWIL